MYYREDKAGQILEEGINEAGAFCSWIAAATSYSTNNVVMVPFYIFYSMFGLQRIGDLAWAAGDQRARGFLLGGTAGRTTLNGEGLQHEDGHSHVLSSVIPNCVSYDPTFGYELARDHPRRPAPHGDQPGGRVLLHHRDERELRAPGAARGRRGAESSRACTCSSEGGKHKLRVQLLGSGTILREVIAAAELLENGLGASAPTSGARPASPSCAATASTASAGTCCIRRNRRASPT